MSWPFGYGVGRLEISGGGALVRPNRPMYSPIASSWFGLGFWACVIGSRAWLRWRLLGVFYASCYGFSATRASGGVD